MKVLFFASLREQLDADPEEWSDLSNIQTVADVLSKLHARGEDWQKLLDPSQILISLNQEMVNTQSLVSKGDELAFMPPVTGG